MNVATLLFYFFILLAAAAAGGILLIKNVFKCAMLLLICLLSVAALYVLAFAEFVAVSQILIYAGGVLVLIIFGIMLTTRITGVPLVAESTHLPGGLIAGLSLLVLLLRFLREIPATNTFNIRTEPVDMLALQLFSDYALPFEIAGLLLLIALIGAAVLTAHIKTKT